MGIFDGCLLISDIDGTLMNNGIIPKQNVDAIEWFKSEGGVFTIATGRQASAAFESYKLVKANAPLLAVQGGVIYDCKENRVLSQANLNPEIYDTVFDILNKFPTVGCEICCGVDSCLLKENIGTRWHSEYEKTGYLPLPEDVKTLSTAKILFVADDDKTYKELIEYSKQFNFDYCYFVASSNTPVARYLEILPANINKGVAAKELKKILNAKYSFGIGDFDNDFELIRDTDYGAAVLGAPERVKQVANYVTCACEDGAVADFINKIHLFLKGSSVWIR